MQTKFSEEVISLAELKINPGEVMSHAKDTHRPILLTSRGKGVAVVQGLEDFEQKEEERAFMKAVVVGLMEVCEDKELGLEEVKRRTTVDCR